MIISSDHLGGRVFRIEHQAVAQCNCSDLTHDAEHRRGAVFRRTSCEINIAGGSPRFQGAEQDAAFENEAVSVCRMCQAIEEAFERVELDQLVCRPTGALRLSLQVEISPSGLSIPCCPFHRTTSKARRTARSAPWKERAISINAAGLAPRRRSQRRRASHAISGPSR